MSSVSVDTTRPSLHDEQALEQFRRRLRIDPDRLRRVRHGLYHAHEPVEEAVARLPLDAIQELKRTFDCELLKIETELRSELDQSSKIVVVAADGARVETVVLRSPTGRTACCVSTQVGCRAGCPFCATARMGLVRNLTSAEIVEQVLVAGRTARRDGRRLRNVVFMGMGEPLDNYSALVAAIRCLTDDARCRFPARRLLVSTVGIPEKMERLVGEFPGIQLAISLHSAIPALRSRLVPWSRNHEWGRLRDAIASISRRPFTHRKQTPLMIEHIMIDGVNDRDEDLEALVEFLDGLNVHVNLIPYNPIPHVQEWQPTPRWRRDEFAEKLRAAGLFTTVRYSMGADIAAACGQLIQRGEGRSER